MVKNPPANMGEVDSTSGLGPWTKKWQCTPVFLPGESRGQRSLEDYSLGDLKESEETERD